MIKVFLGGTANKSTWRDQLTPQLEIDYFDPIVADWNEEAYQRELRERQECDFCLYLITPRMKGFYSIAEVVDDSNKRPERTLFCVLEEDGELRFDAVQKKSLTAVGKMVTINGGRWFRSMDEVVQFLNSYKDQPLSEEQPAE